jgi:hypothetical protein
MTSSANFRAPGEGKAAHWRLTELETAWAPPSMDCTPYGGTTRLVTT